MLGVKVYTENISNNPCCDHGPTILFERILANGLKKKFFACSACRDRKVCGFYHSEDKLILDNVDNLQKTSVSNKSFQFCVKQFDRYKKLTEKYHDVCYCATCSLLLPENLLDSHSKCNIIRNLTERQLNFPSHLFPPQSNSKLEAQYMFTEKSIRIILHLLKGLNTEKVLCIGTPRIHEEIRATKDLLMSSLLLDIDERYGCFFAPTEFLTYNLFNHYFFGGEDAKDIYRGFLKGNEKIAIVIDPPFGGRMELIANTLGIIEKEWQRVNNIEETCSIIPILLVFPYFLEKSVLASLPSFSMLDYQVDYDNHPVYTTGPKGMKHGSAVRIFVNLHPELFPLPEDEGYWYCVQCKRWSYRNNVHCDKCSSCTSKDGRTYKHCDSCMRCVKPSWIHCGFCKVCKPTDHICCSSNKRIDSLCHSCKKIGHKWRDCKMREKAMKRKKKRKRSLPLMREDEKKRDAEVLRKVLRKR